MLFVCQKVMAVRKYSKNSGLSILWDIKMIEHEENPLRRKIREALQIMEGRPAMNCDTNYKFLPIYRRVLSCDHHGDHMTCIQSQRKCQEDNES